MWYMEDVANQREREIAARTGAPLFTRQPTSGRRWPAPKNLGAARRAGVDRSQAGRVKLPRLSSGKWRHWAAGPDHVHCSRAASIAGTC